MTPESPQEENKRKKLPRTYDIFEDQIRWLDNSSLNKSKKIRELLDNFINEMDASVIQNLNDEISVLNKIIVTLKESILNYVNKNQELTEKIESQKSVIVALGGEE